MDKQQNTNTKKEKNNLSEKLSSSFKSYIYLRGLKDFLSEMTDKFMSLID